jgi:hypothetical protein
MPEVIQLGPLFLQGKWLAAALGFVAGLLVLSWQARVYSKEVSEALKDSFLTGGLIIVLIWKFSPLILQPSLLKSPQNLLFLSGDKWGLVIGVIGALLYTAYSLHKKGMEYRFYLDIIAMPIVVLWLIYFVLVPVYGKVTDFPWGITLNEQTAYHPIHYYHAISAFLAIVVIWGLNIPPGSGKRMSAALLFLGVGGWLISFWARSFDWSAGLQTAQWYAILLIAAGFVMWPKKMSSNV